MFGNLCNIEMGNKHKASGIHIVFLMNPKVYMQFLALSKARIAPPPHSGSCERWRQDDCDLAGSQGAQHPGCLRECHVRSGRGVNCNDHGGGGEIRKQKSPKSTLLADNTRELTAAKGDGEKG